MAIDFCRCDAHLLGLCFSRGDGESGGYFAHYLCLSHGLGDFDVKSVWLKSQQMHPLYEEFWNRLFHPRASENDDDGVLVVFHARFHLKDWKSDDGGGDGERIGGEVVSVICHGRGCDMCK